MRPIKKLDIKITDIDVVPNLQAWQEFINLIQSETGLSLVTESTMCPPAGKKINTDSLWDIPSKIKTALKEQLISEQKGFCCYCGRKIHRENIVVEHLNPRTLFPHIMFSYRNLYASCTGYVHSETDVKQATSKATKAKATCCDRRKKDERIAVQPIFEDQYIAYPHDNCNDHQAASCEGRVRFLSDGEIEIDDPISLGKENTVTKLNLNAEKLVEKRYELYEQVEDIVKYLKIKHKEQAALIQQELLHHIQIIQKEIDESQSIDFAFVKIYFLKEKISKLA